MKKMLKAALFTTAVMVGFSGCTKKVGSEENKGKAEVSLKVGMVTDTGTIDDKSFNQGTWEGILQAEKELGVEVKYLKPVGATEADYLKEMSNLYDAGFRMIVCPGFKFETAVYKAQSKYPDAKFVIIDGNAHPADSSAPANAQNTVGIIFMENEASFLAGVAAALEVKEGKSAFIGGMEIPAVQKFNWGWQQGLKYANENLGTKIEMSEENFVYQGTFSDIAAGQQIAASMFDKGVTLLHAAAGGVGVGVANEAKNRAQSGNKVWVVGCDVDQYAEGIIPSGESIILTSAMKYINKAAFDMVKAELEGNFPGGKTLVFSAKDGGVGIPPENPNLSDEVKAKVSEISDKIKSGEIVVSAEQGNLFK